MAGHIRRQIQDAHGVWYAPGFAASYIGFTRSILCHWRTNGCPYLNGRSIITKIFEGMGKRRIVYYLQAQLDEIRMRRANLSDKPNVPGFVTKKEAREITGYDDRHLRSIMASGSPFLDGHRPETIRVSLRIKGFIRQVVLLSLSDLKELVRNRRTCHKYLDDRLSIRQTADYLGIAVKTVRSWCVSGCPHLGGRKPDSVRGYTCFRGQTQQSLLLDRKDVNAIRDRLSREWEIPYVDERGEWLPLSAALRHFPHARKDLLCRYRNKACPQLDGQILHARQIRAIVKHTHRESIVWAFLLEDLKRLAIPQSGIRPNPTRASLQSFCDDRQRIWLPPRLACNRFDISQSMLTYFRKLGQLQGRQIRCSHLKRLVWFYLETDLEQLATTRGVESYAMPSACREDDPCGSSGTEPLPQQPWPVYILQPPDQPIPVRCIECGERRSAEACTRPVWDEEASELSWDGRLVRRYTAPAKNQRDIIEAFARAGWPRRINDPFENAAKLNKTLADLNAGLTPQTIRFRADGTGEGAIWDAAVDK